VTPLMSFWLTLWVGQGRNADVRFLQAKIGFPAFSVAIFRKAPGAIGGITFGVENCFKD